MIRLRNGTMVESAGMVGTDWVRIEDGIIAMNIIAKGTLQKKLKGLLKEGFGSRKSHRLKIPLLLES
jgi:hypothetical protein